ncbi:ABC transporter permease [Bacillus spongiae]|uniref:ABC transporter permease n=1 Tax=Bacillus spongiae TaxID=2683610 RepID=A0ABU8HAM6_9BACI
MLLATNLFIKRYIQEWRFQWGVIRSVLDWTVLIYITVPALFFGSLLYMKMWEDANSYWHSDLPFSFLLIPILVACSSGNFRTYLLKADLLFLLQHKQVIQRLKMVGFTLSVFRSFLFIAFIIFMAFPIIRQVYLFSLKDVVALFLGVSAYMLTIQTVKKIVVSTLVKWATLILLFFVSAYMLLTASSSIVGAGSVVFILTILTYHIRQIFLSNRWFIKEVDIENIEKTRMIKFIFQFSNEVKQPSFSKKKKPRIFYRQSQQIFQKRNAENGLLEFLLKAFMRNSRDRSSYIQLISITLLAVSFLPLVLKWIVYISFIFFFHVWLKNLFDKMVANHFFHVIPIDEELSLNVWHRFKKWLLIPAMTGISAYVLMFTLIEIIISG